MDGSSPAYCPSSETSRRGLLVPANLASPSCRSSCGAIPDSSTRDSSSVRSPFNRFLRATLDFAKRSVRFIGSAGNLSAILRRYICDSRGILRYCGMPNVKGLVSGANATKWIFCKLCRSLSSRCLCCISCWSSSFSGKGGSFIGIALWASQASRPVRPAFQSIAEAAGATASCSVGKGAGILPSSSVFHASIRSFFEGQPAGWSNHAQDLTPVLLRSTVTLQCQSGYAFLQTYGHPRCVVVARSVGLLQL